MYYPAFRFVTYGIVGSLFFFTLRDLGFRNALAVLVVLFFFESTILWGSFEHGRLLNDAISFVIAPLAIGMFTWLFHSKVKVITVFDPFILGTMFAATGALTRIALDMQRQVPVQYWTIFRPWQLAPDLARGFLIGAGLGVGFLLTERRRADERRA